MRNISGFLSLLLLEFLPNQARRGDPRHRHVHSLKVKKTTGLPQKQQFRIEGLASISSLGFTMTDHVARIENLVKSRLRRSRWPRIISLVTGCLLAVVVIGHLIRFAWQSLQGYSMNVWYLLLQAWFLGLATYLISFGTRKTLVATQGNKRPGIGWGAVLAGTFLLMSSSYGLLHPNGNQFTLDPSDRDVQMFTKIFVFAFLLLGVRFVFLGVWRGFSGLHKRTAQSKSNGGPD